jgi:hypothetical protein
MVWSQTEGHSYLMRAAYDKQGRRRHSSLGPRSPETDRINAEFERARREAAERIKQLQPVLALQAGVNRALGLGRVPLIGARIIRSLDANGLLGAGIRVLGTNAIYAYEAAAGVHIDSSLTTTEDVDLLLDSRSGSTNRSRARAKSSGPSTRPVISSTSSNRREIRRGRLSR